VIAAGGGWQAQWLWSGGVALTGFAAVLLVVPDAPPNAPSAGATADGPVGSAAGLGALIAAYGLFGFGYVITATFISTMVRLGAGPAWLETAAWLVVGLAAIPSVAFWSAMAARLGAMAAFAGARAAAPGNPTRAIALMTASFGLGQMVGPTVGGVLADWTGSFTVPSLAAAAALVAAAALAFGFGPGQSGAKAAPRSG